MWGQWSIQYYLFFEEKYSILSQRDKSLVNNTHIMVGFSSTFLTCNQIRKKNINVYPIFIVCV